MGSGVAILYLWLIAPLLLKDREMNLSDDSLRIFQARVNLEEGSLAIGKTVAEAQSLIGEEVTIVRIRRGNTYILPLPDVVLKAGDRIRLSGTTTNINAAADSLKATLYAEEKITDEDHPLWAENQQLAEIAIVNGSLLDGTTLRNTNFLEKFQLIVLALHRSGRDIWQAHEEIMDVTLEHGDVLLVQGSRDMIHNLKVSPDFLVLDASKEVPHTEKALTALLIMAGVVVVAALNLLPILMSSIAGVLLMLLTRCLDLDQAFRALSASVILVVVASLAIGQALQVTGATLYITDVFLYVFGNSSPAVIMSGLMLLIGILTNIVSNNAAAVIGTPIAVSIAQQLNVPTEPFILAVLFGANLSFATPMSYNTNLLVMSAGNYSFNDFVKVGAPLTLLMWAVYSYILSSLYLL
jgi:di/tricarboxylate transporter